MSRNDDGRILVALRDGLAFRYKFGSSAGWGNSFGHWYIEHADGRHRSMDWPCTRRLRDRGLIEHTSDEIHIPADCETRGIQNWTLTEAGQSAAATLPAIPDDKMFAAPKVTPPEKLEAARHKLKANKIAGALTFNSARIQPSSRDVRGRRQNSDEGVGVDLQRRDRRRRDGAPGAAPRILRRHRR